jgi:peptidoglycan glycosyltransferase
VADNIRRLGRSLLLGFCLVAFGLAYWQVVRAPGLLARADNPRLVQAELQVRRGRLLDRNAQVLAYSEVMPASSGSGEIVERRYPDLAAGHAAGYYSLRYGMGGAEAAFDGALRGQLGPLDRVLHRPQIGRDVALSIDFPAQQTADRAMADRPGALVVLDITDGAVLVLVSHPGYDANRLDEEWEGLSTDRSAPLLNRVTQGVYPLGDLARLVGLAGLLSAGTTTPPDPLSAPLDPMLAPLGRSGYLASAVQLGFDRAPQFELPTGAGRLPDFGGKGTPRDLAVTPLHMARLMAAVAGDGELPRPQLAFPSAAVSGERAFSADVAARLRAISPRLDGVAAWTGVATPDETGAKPLSWLAGYAPDDAPRYSVVVLLEESDAGAAVTLPAALQTLQALQ